MSHSNTTPLRNSSPGRQHLDYSQNQQPQQHASTTVQETQQHQQQLPVYASSTISCAGGPTEKERMIQQLMQEVGDLRQRERDYRALQDQLLNLEQNFGRLNEDKRRMDEDYKSRVDGNIRFIQTLRSEVDEQRSIFNDRKKQNADLNTELDR